MPETKKLPLRSEIKPEDTWDLTPLYKTNAGWEQAYKQVEKKLSGYEAFRGKLGNSAKTLRACFDFDVALGKSLERLGSYAFLRAAEDVSDSEYQGMAARYTRLATRAGEASSFIAPELRAIAKKKMDRFLKSAALKPYRFQLEKLLRLKPHILSAKEERLLAMQGEISDTAERVFEQLNDADLSFGFVKNETGESVALTHGSFRVLLESPSRRVRREAFRKFYAMYEGHANTFAAALNGSVLQDIYYARARNYPSAIEAALFRDNIPVSVYDSLIDAVHDNLDTVYRYLEVRRKALKARDLHFYDNYVPLAAPARKRTPYGHAVTMVCEALRPLGDAYCKTLEAGLRGRWVDRYENKGKRSGAFSAGGYVGPPYMLMNYKEAVVDSVFTLAHEAGHSMHTYYSARAQPFQYYHYNIFVAEVASTFNEQLLSRYLLDNARDNKTRIYLVAREIDELRGTLVRQTMFAEFEKVIHAVAEAGEPLTLDRLREEYRKLLDRYFGNRFVVDEALSLEGLRIPHFYRAFYVYKYATGISAAIALAKMVEEGGEGERRRYLRFLKAGGSKYPLEILHDAGVDMEKPEPVADAMTRFKRLVDELDELL